MDRSCAASRCSCATFVASWWLIGDLTEPGIRRYNLDYVVRPPNLSRGAVTAGGVVGLVVVAAIVLWLIVAVARWTVAPRAADRRESDGRGLRSRRHRACGDGRLRSARTSAAAMAFMFGVPIVVILLVYAVRQFGKIRNWGRRTVVV